MSVCYPLLCELLSLELKYEVRCLLRRVFNRIGKEYSICNSNDNSNDNLPSTLSLQLGEGGETI